MQDNPQQVTIHLARLGKPERSYPEGLVDDNGRRVKTFSIVPEPASAQLSETFQGQGWILPGQRIHSVSKVLFYNEFFSIVDYHDPAGRTIQSVISPSKKKVCKGVEAPDVDLEVHLLPDVGELPVEATHLRLDVVDARPRLVDPGMLDGGAEEPAPRTYPRRPSSPRSPARR